MNEKQALQDIMDVCDRTFPCLSHEPNCEWMRGTANQCSCFMSYVFTTGLMAAQKLGKENP